MMTQSSSRLKFHIGVRNGKRKIQRVFQMVRYEWLGYKSDRERFILGDFHSLDRRTIELKLLSQNFTRLFSVD